MPRTALILVAFTAVSCREPAPPDAPPPPSSAPFASAPAPASAAGSAPASSSSTSAPDPTSSGEVSFPVIDPHKQELGIVAKDDIVALDVAKDQSHASIRRIRFHRELVWEHPLPNQGIPEAAIVVDVPAKLVYVASYSAISSGATVMALDLDTGKDRWSTPVQGLGPVSHSKYFNRVAMTLDPAALTVFGDEAQGRYIEVFNPATGKMIRTRVLPPSR